MIIIDRALVKLIVLQLLFNCLCFYNFQCSSQKWKKQPRIYLNQRQILVPTAHNIKIIIDPANEYSSKNILTKGTWQQEILNLISILVKPGNAVLNVGSQNGLQAVLMGKLIGQSGKLFVIEPSSASFRILVKNIYLNQLNNISKCYRLAADARSSKIYLKINQKQPQTEYLTHRTGDRGPQQFEEVIQERIDAVLPVNTKLDFAFIKSGMNVVEAMLGMRQIINQSPQLIALVKWQYLTEHYRRDVQQMKQFLQFLDNKGFVWMKFTNNIKKPCQLGGFQKIKYQNIIDLTRVTLLLVGPATPNDMKLKLGL